MAYSIVGSAGPVSIGAAGAAVTPAWGANSPRSKGNLLVCWAASFSTSLMTIPTGWTQAVRATPVAISYLVAAGSDPAPTVGPVGATSIAAQLAEFTGNDAGRVDAFVGPAASAATGFSAVNPVPDFQAQELYTYCSMASYTVANSGSLSNFLNNGTTVYSSNNNGSNVAHRYDFGWGITAVNTLPDQDNFSFPSASISTARVCQASFRLLPVTPTQFPPRYPTNWSAVRRGMYR